MPDAPLARFIILPVTADFVYTRGRVIITWNVQILYASENYAPPIPGLLLPAQQVNDSVAELPLWAFALAL